LSNRMDSRPKARLCVDNSTIESVQLLTLRSRVKVTTLTHLDDLVIEDDCDCQQLTPLPRNVKPMHLVFLIDGSDGYNEKTRNRDGYTEANAFALTMKWVYNFINSSNFVNRNQRTFVSIIQFSGCAQDIETYIPGSMGVARPESAANPTATYHWMFMEDSFVKPSKTFFDANKKVESLDGNGSLYLALQDVSLREGQFIQAMDKKMAEFCDISKGIERTMVICTDEEWDIKNLQCAHTGQQAEPMDIINMANETYDRIYAVIASDYRNAGLNKELIAELRKTTIREDKPKLYDINNKNNMFELRLMRAGDQIQLDLDISD